MLRAVVGQSGHPGVESAVIADRLVDAGIRTGDEAVD